MKNKNTDEVLKIEINKFTVVLGVIFFLVLTTFLILYWYYNDIYILIIIGIVLGGYSTFNNANRYFWDRYGLILTKESLEIHIMQGLVEILKWEDIESIGITKLNGTDMIEILPKNQKEYALEKNKRLWTLKSLFFWGPNDWKILISPRLLKADRNKLLEELNSYLNNSKS